MDEQGISALHHAANASSYSWRAMKAAHALVRITPLEVMNHQTTGTRAIGYTPLHFASESSNKGYNRVDLVTSLIANRANLEPRTQSGNTPFTLASGAGVSGTMQALIDANADVNATNKLDKGCYQKAAQSSGSARSVLQRHGLTRPNIWAASGRQRGDNVSEARKARYLQKQG